MSLQPNSPHDRHDVAYYREHDPVAYLVGRVLAWLLVALLVLVLLGAIALVVALVIGLAL